MQSQRLTGSAVQLSFTVALSRPIVRLPHSHIDPNWLSGGEA